MSATNTTTNYNLPIFIETDKPAWLVDFNGAMRSIDAQMKINADAIATKSPLLTFNDTADIDFTKSGDIITANLSSGVAGTVSRAFVKPVSAPASQQFATVDTSNNQQMVSIGTGLALENNTLNAIDLNLSDITSITSVTGLPSSVSIVSCNLTLAVNNDKSVGKFYGALFLRNTSTTTASINVDTGLVVASPVSSYTIAPAGLTIRASQHAVGAVSLTIGTNGHINIVTQIPANDTSYLYIFPCLYFFKDFGDTPTP